jgi:hypothetical protein
LAFATTITSAGASARHGTDANAKAAATITTNRNSLSIFSSFPTARLTGPTSLCEFDEFNVFVV